MDSSPCGDASTNDLIVVTQIRHPFPCRYFPRYLDNVIAAFVISWPRVVKNLVHGALIILVRILYFRSINFPNTELRQSLAKPRLAGLVLIDSVQPHSLPLQERYYTSSFVGPARNPARVATRLGFQFQKLVYIAFKQAAFMRFGVVSSAYSYTS